MSQDYVNGTDQEEIRTGKKKEEEENPFVDFSGVTMSSPVCTCLLDVCYLPTCLFVCLVLSACLPLKRCGSVHPEVPGCGETDGMFFLAEKAAAVCAEARASCQRGNVQSHLGPPSSVYLVVDVKTYGPTFYEMAAIAWAIIQYYRLSSLGGIV